MNESNKYSDTIIKFREIFNNGFPYKVGYVGKGKKVYDCSHDLSDDGRKLLKTLEVFVERAVENAFKAGKIRGKIDSLEEK